VDGGGVVDVRGWRCGRAGTEGATTAVGDDVAGNGGCGRDTTGVGVGAGAAGRAGAVTCGRDGAGVASDVAGGAIGRVSGPVIGATARAWASRRMVAVTASGRPDRDALLAAGSGEAQIAASRMITPATGMTTAAAHTAPTSHSRRSRRHGARPRQRVPRVAMWARSAARVAS
jgi:hypothetical protein